jgi:hypothetical protein
MSGNFQLHVSRITLILSLSKLSRASVRKIPKPVLETTLIMEESTYTLNFKKYLFVSFWSHSFRAFSVLLEDSLFQIVSET